MNGIERICVIIFWNMSEQSSVASDAKKREKKCKTKENSHLQKIM